jgi:DNA-binding beta-propeller fold protein YncE
VTYVPPRPGEQPSAAQPPAAEQGDANAPPAPAIEGKPLQPLVTVSGLGKPRAAAADGLGNFYIYTETDSKVHKFDPTGSEIVSWEVKDTEGKLLTEGSAMAVLGEQVLVLDGATSNAIRFTLDGEPEGSITLCQCFFPRGMGVTNDGNLWVANTGGNQIIKVSPDGNPLEALGAKGDAPGQFFEPAGVWQAPDGMLAVVDISNARVQTFNASHEPLKQWPIGKSVARDGNRLVGDSAGNILVTQGEAQAIVLYDRDGKELDRWVYTNQGTIFTPAGIASMGNGNIIALYPEAGIAAIFKPE